jgi:hypothetical protein
MGKYARLREFLANHSFSEVPLTFAGVEKILQSRLPRSAAEHRAWWANETHGHVHAKAWLDAGYETVQVDMAAKKLVFRRLADSAKKSGTTGFRREPQPSLSSIEKQPRRSTLFGVLKGTFTIEPGYDLTQPSMPEWADALDETFGPDLPR